MSEVGAEQDSVGRRGDEGAGAENVLLLERREVGQLAGTVAAVTVAGLRSGPHVGDRGAGVVGVGGVECGATSVHTGFQNLHTHYKGGIKLQPSFYYFTQAFLQPRPERQRTARLSCHSHRDKVFKYLGGAQGAD